MRVAIGADHAGYELKQDLLAFLGEEGIEALDVGTDSTAPVDYPDFSAAVAERVTSGEVDRGIIVCGSGAGAAIAANKVHGARAALAHDTYTAHQCVEHDDANILALGSRVVGIALARELVLAFLAARFSGEERHARRLAKVQALDDARPGAPSQPR